MTRLILASCACAVLVALGAGASTAPAGPRGGPPTEVVVTLAGTPLAGRTSSAARTTLDREQARFTRALGLAVPGARVHWRYRIVLNGYAVVVPRGDVDRLRALPGVRSVDTSVAYPVARTQLTRAGRAARAWIVGLPNQGTGMKIGFIDDGVDQTHPYFAAAGYTMPAGYPKGQAAYTTAKVIVARAFAPANATYRYARVPFDPTQSQHATHVAGIAAGNAGTSTGSGVASGVAPRAYIGNYKALGIPTPAVGLDGNAAEIVAAIEAAVQDGMNVVNLSIGEPEVAPSRDIVAAAIDGAAAAGVIPVVAAGNDYDEFGRGSVSSPGSAEKAITVAAVTTPVAGGRASLASFSSAGPTALSLRLKPDVSAPGVSILSSVPGGWETMSGTSMATPQIAGVVALLKERHPGWSVATIKSALMSTATQVEAEGQPAPPVRGGGGLAVPVRADVPLLTSTPASVSFGLLAAGATATATVALTDVDGGAGTWDVAVETVGAVTPGASLTAAPTTTVPGTLVLTATAAASAADGELSGFVRLTRGLDVRRIPFWAHVERPGLASASPVPMGAPGAKSGNTRGKPSLASRYRYPDVPAQGAVTASLQGPEQLFRVTLTRPVANFGVVVTGRGAGVRVEPRVMAAGDENRLTGYPALPLNLNPYLREFGARVLAAGAVRPTAGSYDVVFDSPTAAGAGPFTFRYWVDDTTPPRVVLGPTRVSRGTRLTVRVTDTGSGVDASTLLVSIDGRSVEARLQAGVLRLPTATLARGRHTLRIQVSDYQESRNMENVPPILPNTRVVTTSLVVR